MNSLVLLQQRLREHHQSITTVRSSIFSALLNQEPMSMVELVHRCPDADRASVYRTVQLFEQLGIVQRLQTGWKYKLELSSDFHDHHHHATCLRCGQTTVLAEDVTLEHGLQALAAIENFQITRHQLELQGYCKTCKD